MTKLILSAYNSPNLSINANGKSIHSNLKNLDFASSGHTGFQKELTEQQIQNIESVSLKENSANKVTAISGKSTDTEYPSAKAVYTEINNARSDLNSSWELIEEVTLTEDVQEFSPSINGKYKELYFLIRIPTMNPTALSNFQKGRTYLYVQNNVKVADEAAYLYEDKGKEWFIVYRISVVGNNCTVTRMHTANAANAIDNAYAMATTSAGFIMMHPGKKLAQNFVSALRVLMYPLETRCFPAGTTYELWGVKA